LRPQSNASGKIILLAARNVATTVIDRIEQLATFPGLGRAGEVKGTRELVSPPYVAKLLTTRRPRELSFAEIRETKLVKKQSVDSLFWLS
jgi:plasmid stabilization system protein ParE